LPVAQVVHIAVNRRAAASRPGAGAVAKEHRAADRGWDGVGVALIGILYL